MEHRPECNDRCVGDTHSMRAGRWTTERQLGDDAECERLGCEDRTHPVHHRLPFYLDAPWSDANGDEIERGAP